jgi:hypothetical protein
VVGDIRDYFWIAAMTVYYLSGLLVTTVLLGLWLWMKETDFRHEWYLLICLMSVIDSQQAVDFKLGVSSRSPSIKWEYYEILTLKKAGISHFLSSHFVSLPYHRITSTV